MNRKNAVITELVDVEKSVYRYKKKINEQLGLIQKSMVDIGRILNDAQKNLKNKEYRELENDIVLGKRTIQKLKRVAADMRIEKHKDKLPVSWGTLYELTKLDDKTFNEGVKKGVINCKTQRKEIISLIKPGSKESKGRLLVEIREKKGANEFQIEDLMRLLNNVDEDIFEVTNKLEAEYHRQQKAELNEEIKIKLKEVRVLVRKTISQRRNKIPKGSRKRKIFEEMFGDTEVLNSTPVNELLGLLDLGDEYKILDGYTLSGH